MIRSNHDPRDFVKGLQQLLISDTKRVGFLFGAGTSCAVKKGGCTDSKVPAAKEMTKLIVDSIIEPHYKTALECIRQEFNDSNIDYNIEYILSNIIQKEQVVANDRLCGLNKGDLQKLREIIEKEIINLVSVHKKSSAFIDNLIHADFAKWILQASRKHPIEIFTTNYDYLFELGLEHQDVAYFDGFVGSFEPFFYPSSIEDLNFLPQYTKLWKLHGSLGWYFNQSSNKIVRKQPNGSNILIYPSFLKYDDSKKQPYVSFMDRLSTFIKKDDSILFVCGYSFSDAHINDILIRALEKTSTSHIIGLYYGDLPQDSKVVKLASCNPKFSLYGSKYAVIGGKYGKWKLKSEPCKDDSIIIDLYFDEDVAEPTEEKGQDQYKWTGEGQFLLPDFTHFVQFLSFLNYEIYKLANGAK